MTTQIHIVNSSDSNPRQHAHVTVTKHQSGAEFTHRLAPGDSKGIWLSPGDTVKVEEQEGTKDSVETQAKTGSQAHDPGHGHSIGSSTQHSHG